MSAGRIEDGEIHAGQWLARRTHALVPFQRMVFRRQCDNGARRFRHPVHLNKTAAEHFHAFPQESQRDWTGAVGDVFEVAVIDATRPRLVSAIARGRRWLNDVVSGRVTTVAELCAREQCSVRQVNMTVSYAFLAPDLVKAAVEGRLPRGIGVERLRDQPAEWSRQFEALGLKSG